MATSSASSRAPGAMEGLAPSVDARLKRREVAVEATAPRAAGARAGSERHQDEERRTHQAAEGVARRTVVTAESVGGRSKGRRPYSE